MTLCTEQVELRTARKSSAPKSRAKKGGPDLAMAGAFIRCFDGLITFQTFADHDRLKRKEVANTPENYAQRDNPRAKLKTVMVDPLATIRHGILDDYADELVRLNSEGAGIFFAVNEMDGAGRKLENFKRFRAVFADMDTNKCGTTSPKWPLTPSLIVASNGGVNRHVYWLIEGDIAEETWRGVGAHLIAEYGADTNATDRVRVLRVPGFAHCKGTPKLAKLLECSGRRYTAEELVKAFPPVERRTATRVESSGEVANSNDVRSALKHLAAVIVPGSEDRETHVDDRAEWIKCGIALKREYGDNGFLIWQDWSKVSKKYDEDDCHATWQSFDVDTRQGDDAVTVRSIFKAARDAGWRNSSFVDRWLGGVENVVPFTPKRPQTVTVRRRVWVEEADDYGWEEEEVDADDPATREPHVEVIATRGETKEESEAAPPDQPSIPKHGVVPKSMRLTEMKQIEWLCEDLVAIGAITTIYGHSNVGKSTILSDIIAGVTAGRALPGEPADTAREPGSVCLLGGEEDLYATVLPRLVAAGAIVDRVHAFDTLFADNKEGERTERAVMLKHDMHRLDAFLDENPQVRMIVFDPLMNFMSGADPNDAVELRAVLTGLKALAEKHRLSILIVAHTRKSSEGPAIDRLAGSGALQQVSRSVLLVGKHPDDTDADNRSPRRVLMTVKNNEIAEPVILSFKIETACVNNGNIEIKTRRAVWGERLSCDGFAPEQVLDGRAGSDKEGKITAAVKWLREYMVPDKTYKQGEITAAARDAGHSERTLERAKKLLGVHSRKGGLHEGWLWMLANPL